MYRYHGIRPTPEALSLEISWGRRMLASWYHPKELCRGFLPIIFLTRFITNDGTT